MAVFMDVKLEKTVGTQRKRFTKTFRDIRSTVASADLYDVATKMVQLTTTPMVELNRRKTKDI